MIGSVAAVEAALEVAADGLRRGEMPIGAVIFLGDDPIARYAAGDGPAGMRAWARGLAEL